MTYRVRIERNRWVDTPTERTRERGRALSLLVLPAPMSHDHACTGSGRSPTRKMGTFLLYNGDTDGFRRPNSTLATAESGYAFSARGTTTFCRGHSAEADALWDIPLLVQSYSTESRALLSRCKTWSTRTRSTLVTLILTRFKSPCTDHHLSFLSLTRFVSCSAVLEYIMLVMRATNTAQDVRLLCGEDRKNFGREPCAEPLLVAVWELVPEHAKALH